MLFSSFLVCLAHGSNDIANAISPLLIIMRHEKREDWESFLIGSTGISIGLLLLGRIVIKTVGKEIIDLDF